MRWTALLLVGICSLYPVVASAENDSDKSPADVMVAVSRFASDLEALRLYMGRPAVTNKRFQVEFAAPRHDFFQAQTMVRKVNRLGSEVAGLMRQPPTAAPEHHAIVSSDVLEVVAQAQGQLDLIRAALGIETQDSARKRNRQIEAKDVFEELAQINRQLNLMIDDPFLSSDVHTQLSLANVYLAGVLMKQDKEYFPTVPFVANKQPLDVYELLIDCFALNQRVGERMEIPVLRINARRLKRDHSIRSDNYDLATILLSDVAFWSARLAHDEDVIPPAEPQKNVFPAHVYAKAESVREQLSSIVDSI